MVEDPEISAMSTIAAALAEVEDDDARVRVLRWATTRFAPSVRVSAGTSTQNHDDESDNGGSEHPSEFVQFVDLFDALHPRTEAERALVGGYWHQVIMGAQDFPAMTINNDLKNLGHGASNITDALSTLQQRRPALVRQVAKSGRSRQARKKYKLTTAGIAEVKRMLGAGGGESEA